MSLSTRAKEIHSRIDLENAKLGDLRKVAKEIKKDHDLGQELWSTGEYYPRMLAILIMDKNLLTQAVIDQLVEDMNSHSYERRNRLSDWLLANQLMKSKKTIALLESWEHHPTPILRRLFWYYQARLRWTGKTQPDNTADLFAALQNRLANEEPEVQWAMNFTAGQIGVHQPEYRQQCMALGEKLGLYKDEPVVPNCTPNYLPEFIRIEVGKREK
jgi:3-methyladenine DNA glycosylase AlkD